MGRRGERGSGISVLAARHDDVFFPQTPCSWNNVYSSSNVFLYSFFLSHLWVYKILNVLLRSTPNSPELEPNHQMQFCVIVRTLLFFFWGGGLNPSTGR